MSRTYKVELLVDEGWLRTIHQVTDEIYDGELCEFIKVEEVDEQ